MAGIGTWQLGTSFARAGDSDGKALPSAIVQPARTDAAAAQRRTARLPLFFEPNVGQLPAAAAFAARGSGYQLLLAAEGATWALGSTSDTAPVDLVRMRLVGANADAQAAGGRVQPARAHYFRGSDPSEWRTNVPMFGSVHYRQIYPGVDLEYYGRDAELEYDFVVATGVDPRVIALRFEGAAKMSVDAAGDLVMETKAGRLFQRRPVAYQHIGGARRIVESKYVVTGKNEFGFAIGSYDRGAPLVIDPVISYSTYVGGSGGPYGEHAYNVTVDADNNIYVTGKTSSATFPLQDGQPVNNDVYVFKMSEDGTLVYSAVMNGNGSDSGESIAVDSNGQVIVTGFTDSTNFPLLNPVHGDRSGRDAFAFKLDQAGVLVYSTYLGGASSWDYGEAVVVDAAGNAYIVGTTKSGAFPVLNARQPIISGQDAFVVKLDPAGNLLYGSFLGGTGSEVAEAVAVDDTGSFYVLGWTTSSNFPRVQSTVAKALGEDVFISKFTPDGSGFEYSRFLGGSGSDRPFAVALDGQGGLFLGGWTDSTNFPSVSAFQGDQPGMDVFIARLAADGATLFSTYLGGDGYDRIFGLAVRDGRLYATGETFSTDFPTLDAVQPLKGGDATTNDAFLTTVDIATSTIIASTYVGGAGREEGRGLAPLPGGNVFLVGWTESDDFPTVNPIQPQKSNIANAYVTRFAPLRVDSVSKQFVVTGGGESITLQGQGFVPGASVVIGGAAATGVTVLDGFTVTATTPSLAFGSLDVTVINPDGGSGTLYHGLTAVNNFGPIANAGPDQSLAATSAAATTVLLDGSASFDPDAEPLTFQWTDQNGAVVATGALATATLPVGVNTITLTVSDGHSSPAADTVVVTISDMTPPTVAVVSPNGANKIYTGTATILEWTAADAVSGLSAFDVYLSTNGGTSYDSTPICANVPGSERTCTWTSPGPLTSKGRIRVVARDGAGNTMSDASNANFNISSGTASVKVTSPNTVLNWGAGSTQQIKWNHNLGTSAFTRLELSVDDGATWSVIDPAVKNNATSTGTYNWTVPHALSTTARVRATWVNGAATDQSDVDFTIAEPFIQLSAPGAGANWGYGTTRTQTWSTNLGPTDLVDVVLVTGATPPVSMMTDRSASSKTATFETPVLGSPTASAAVRIVWTNPPAGFSAEGVSPGVFTVEPPFITVGSPNGGEIWSIGSKRNFTWSSNLGTLEKVNLELSQDDGATYAVIVLSGTPADGVQAVNIQSTWATTLGRMRMSWVESPSVSDTSDAAFVIR